MSLGPGRRLGPYEVLSPLGAGGMGQVWRARDTRLGRDVALKALPDDFAGSAERRSRFDQEARLLAALNHPSIAALYDVLEFEGSPVIVMEVVEGETLAERISRGPIPLKTALEIALPIAEALEAAHERGILHRDLKPSNVKLPPGGGVKILDFGLAKALEVEESAATLPKPVERTGTGVAIGTAPYMSPEQARGEPVSKRTDVWAFGCVLYEMLTGRRAFPGATWSDSIAAVLEREPDWNRMPVETPQALHRLLKRCLQKDQRERIREFADTKLELKDLLSESSSPRRTPRRAWKAALGVIAVLAAVGTLIVLRRPIAPAGEIRQPRFQITLPRGVRVDFRGYSTLAISHDGTHVAFVGCGEVCQLYLREPSEIDARPLPGTEGAHSPFFSPEGSWLGFYAQRKLRKVDLKRGTVVSLADAETLRGASWGTDGTILFSTGGKEAGLLRVSADGGEVEAVTKPESGEMHRFPHVLPGGRAALFNLFVIDNSVLVVDLQNRTSKVLIDNASSPKYASSGHVLFGRYGVLYAAPFDVERLELHGTPVPVLDGVAMWSSPSISGVIGGVVAYDLARVGTLLYSPRDARSPRRTLVALDRQGQRESLSESQRAYSNPLLSPDGRRIAVTVQSDVGVMEPFVLDIPSGAWTRVNVEEGTTMSPGSPRYRLVAGWMPDGKRLLHADWHDGTTSLVSIDGSESSETVPMVVEESETSVAPDGNVLLTSRQLNRWDIWRVELRGERVAEPWLSTASDESAPRFSPDGRWVAYHSDESGRFEVYVRPYTGAPARHQVSTQGGLWPRWSGNGREIFFQNAGSVWSVAVRESTTFSAESPRKLFDIPEDIWSDDYDVSPDGERFVMIERDPLELRPFDLVVIPDWTEEMKSRLAAAK